MARKRAKGEGTLTKRKDGTWQGSISLGYHPDGRRNRPVVYGKTQREAREKLEAIKQRASQGTFSDAELTVKAYLERWLKEKERQVKPRTVEIYRYCVDTLIGPRLGHTKLSDLTPLAVQTMIGSIADEVGKSSANKARTVLYSAMKQALRWQLIPRNPVEAVDTIKEQKREMVLWTAEQATRFLDAARSHRLYALFYLAMATGMRRGELLGLYWTDLKGDRLKIERALTLNKGRGVMSTPKTRKGTRWVALSADVLEVLEAHRERQIAERQRLGEAWADSRLVFASEVGTPINPNNIARVRNKLQDEAGVPRARLHDLRHLHASLAIREGMDPKVLADRLGHAKASFTMDVYTHLFEEQRASSAVSLTSFLIKDKVEPDDLD